MTLWITVAACLESPAIAQAESQDTTTALSLLGSTDTVLDRVAKQVEQNEDRLRNVRGGSIAPSDAVGIFMQFGVSPTPTRALNRTASTSGGALTVAFDLPPDATFQVTDTAGTVGVVLTGTWITDYARLIRLVPEYENTLESYRSQAALYEQLIDEYKGTLDIKNQALAVQEELSQKQKERGDLYQEIAKIHRGTWLERALRKVAFPAGLAVGLIAGVIAAR